MNPFSLIPLFALLVNVGTMAYLAGRDLKPAAHRAYLRLGAALGAWLLGDVLLSNTTGAVSGVAEHLYSLTWIPLGLLLLDLIYKTVGKRLDWVWWSTAASVAVAVALVLSSDLYVVGYMIGSYGVGLEPGPAYLPVFFVSVLGPSAWAMVVVAREARLVPVRRVSLVTLLVGTVVGCAANIATDVVAPLLGRTEAPPSLSSLIALLVSGWIIAILVRQGSLVLTLESAARDLFEHLADGALAVDLDGTVRLYNRASVKLLGDLVTPGVRLDELLLECPGEEEVHDYETHTKGDEPRVISLSRSRVRGRDGRSMGHVVVLRDLTRRQEAQVEMAKRQRLESLGVLAGGIAHDFNNALLAIQGNVSLLQATAPPTSPDTPILDEVEEAVVRARQLTLQLLAFSKGGAPILCPVRLETVLDQAARMSLGGSSVSWDLDLEPHLLRVLADEGQLAQVFNNLLLNARDAGATQVRIRAQKVEDEPTGIELAEGPFVRVEVQDNGPGIPEPIQDRVFDPYFTTKDYGSGLGLASAYSIVQRHGGMVRVGNSAGGGALLEVYLPLTERQPAPEVVPRVATAPTALRVLVMDDDRAVRRVSARLLRRFGYRVDVAEHGERAVELYRSALEAGAPYDVVVLDLTVAGGMGGVDTVKELRELHPGLRAVVSSGYSDDPVMSSPADYGFRAVLAKPYPPAALMQAVEMAAGSGKGRAAARQLGEV